MQLTWLDWSRSRSRSFWSRSHNSFLVSVSISVSHSLVSVLALVSLCSGLINKPGKWHEIHGLVLENWICASRIFLFASRSVLSGHLLARCMWDTIIKHRSVVLVYTTRRNGLPTARYSTLTKRKEFNIHLLTVRSWFFRTEIWGKRYIGLLAQIAYHSRPTTVGHT